MPGELLTAWTIRLALACYVIYLAGWLVARPTGSRASTWPTTARWIWTIGCVLFVVHVACAFHFYHGWSHAAAFEKTASETAQLLGFRFGEGIYFSYLFLALWVLDVVWQWAVQRSSRPAFQSSLAPWWYALHTYLFFIAFNGAIVFESGPVRWAGLAACLLLAAAAVWGTYNMTERRRDRATEGVP
jgi:Mn2+/Fe2+ NRAMP family transporter